MTISTKSPTQADHRIGQRIRLRRIALDMSQEKLAAALGLSFQQIQKYEKGQSRVSASRLEEIARVLEVPVIFFYDDEPKRRDTSSIALLNTPQGARLSQAFEAISKPELRRRALELLEAIAEMEV